MKQFKCGNCGSSQYLKVEEDVCVCEYCGAKFKVEKTVKDVFLKDLKTETSVSKNKCAKFMEATFNEEDFRKKVLTKIDWHTDCCYLCVSQSDNRANGIEKKQL